MVIIFFNLTILINSMEIVLKIYFDELVILTYFNIIVVQHKSQINKKS